MKHINILLIIINPFNITIFNFLQQPPTLQHKQFKLIQRTHIKETTNNTMHGNCNIQIGIRFEYSHNENS